MPGNQELEEIVEVESRGSAGKKLPLSLCVRHFTLGARERKGGTINSRIIDHKAITIHSQNNCQPHAIHLRIVNSCRRRDLQSNPANDSSILDLDLNHAALAAA